MKNILPFLVASIAATVSLCAEEAPGLHLSHTMSLLESSSPEHKTPIRILFYGQSITAQGYADRAIVKWIHENYPYAVVSYTNPAIGGYQAPALRQTAWQDMYNQNPDLVVFHVYGGENGELEEIFKGMKEHLTADVITWTHHVDSTPDETNGKRDSTSNLIKTLATKYGYEVAEARTLWKETLEKEKLTPQDFTKDVIHLNDRGGALLGEAVVARLKKNPEASTDWQQRIHTLPLNKAHPGISYANGSWKVENVGLVSTGTTPLRIEFTGNRVDLVGLAGTGGSAKILLDGKVPSTLRDTLAAGRSNKTPGAWWPALRQVTLGSSAVPETYVMKFHDVAPDGSSYVFDVQGSVTGADGEGKSGQPFSANSAHFSLKAGDLAVNNVKPVLHKDLPSEFNIEWPVYSMSKDTWKSPEQLAIGQVPQETVVRCWTDGPHVIEIIPEGNGPVGIRELMVFSPGGKANP